MTPRSTPALACALAILGCVEAPPVEQRTTQLRVGTPLPFTGAAAASGVNVERAMLLAVHRLDEAGGVAGKHLRLVGRDTHSTVSGGVAATLELLQQEKVDYLVGPIEADAAVRSSTMVQAAGTIQILPGPTSNAVEDPVPRRRWFRLGASASLLACELAGLVARDGFRAPLVLHASDDYSITFRNVFVRTTQALRRSPRASLPLAADADVAAVLRQAAMFAPDRLVLVAPPRLGARVVQEWAVLDANTPWYFAPTLDSQAFLVNRLPRTVDGQSGVSSTALHEQAFADVFRAAYNDQPDVDAAAAYDSIVLLGLAIEAAHRATGGTASPEAVDEQIRAVASPPGEPVPWNDVGRALSLLRAGTDIDLEGASGALDLDERGRAAPAFVQTWQVVEGRSIQRRTAEKTNPARCPL